MLEPLCPSAVCPFLRVRGGGRGSSTNIKGGASPVEMGCIGYLGYTGGVSAGCCTCGKPWLHQLHRARRCCVEGSHCGGGIWINQAPGFTACRKCRGQPSLRRSQIEIAGKRVGAPRHGCFRAPPPPWLRLRRLRPWKDVHGLSRGCVLGRRENRLYSLRCGGRGGRA